MNRSRRAISILELMVVLSASTAVLTLSSVLLQRVMRMHIQSRADQGVERTALRLSDRFRRDVHQARAVVTDRAQLGEKVLLRLTCADNRQAEYTYDDGTLLRAESKSGGQVAREEFAFPTDSEVSIESRGTPARVILTIAAPQRSDRDEKDDKQSTHPLTVPLGVQIEATVGSDWRFAGAPGAAEAQP